jgi:hypothetical protein
MEDQIDIHVGTFSKALGGQGGYVAGSQGLYNYLMGFARSRVFSCALAPAVSRPACWPRCTSPRVSRSCARALEQRGALPQADERRRRGRRRIHVADHPDHDPQRSQDPRHRAEAATPACTCSRSSTPRWPNTGRASVSPSRRRTRRNSSTGGRILVDTCVRRGSAVKPGQVQYALPPRHRRVLRIPHGKRAHDAARAPPSGGAAPRPERAVGDGVRLHERLGGQHRPLRRTGPVRARRAAHRGRGTADGARRVLSLPGRHHHEGLARTRHRALAPAALHARHRDGVHDRAERHPVAAAHGGADPRPAHHGLPVGTVEHRYQAYMHDARPGPTWPRWPCRAVQRERGGARRSRCTRTLQRRPRHRRGEHHAVPRDVDARRHCRRSIRSRPSHPDAGCPTRLRHRQPRGRARARGACAAGGARGLRGGRHHRRPCEHRQGGRTVAAQAIAEGCHHAGGGRRRRHVEQRRQRHPAAGRTRGWPSWRPAPATTSPRRPARRRGFPATARLVAEGAETRVDVGHIEDRYFLNIAGFGFDVAVLEDIPSHPRGSRATPSTSIPRCGSWVGYGGVDIDISVAARAPRVARGT